MLVDVRHEASHNELPTLPLLRLAAQQALAWLRAAYWQRQSNHLQHQHTRIVALLQVGSHISAPALALAQGGPLTGVSSLPCSSRGHTVSKGDHRPAHTLAVAPGSTARGFSCSSALASWTPGATAGHV